MKNLRWLFLILLLFLSVSWNIGAVSVRAQTNQSQSLQDQRAQLERQLRAVEAQITQNKRNLTTVRSQKNTLANKISQLNIQKRGLLLKIQATSISLDESAVALSQIQYQIDQNQQQISNLQKHIAVIIQELWKQNQTSWFNIIFTANSFSDFYNNLHSLENVSVNLNTLSASLNTQEQQLNQNQQLLSNRREEQQNLAAIIGLQKDQVSQNIQDQNTLLTETKGQEANYQRLLKKNRAQAAAIRNRIYSLATVATNQQITFGQAVAIAETTSRATGVRAALLLAILTQESNLGKNVGTCNRAGDPPSKSWKVVMKPSRDQGPFKQITNELGLDINTTPISCPMHDKHGKQIGWGGAMGPAQFIPSTWMGYKDKISAITGHPANPWNIKDAFLAAAIKLRADGATSLKGEWAAAMRYFSGGTNPAYSFYGDSVVAQAAKYQKDIDEINSQQ